MDKKKFSLDGLIKKTTVFSFDEMNVYIGEGDAQRTVPFADVLSLSRTNNSLNNRYFWRLEYRLEGVIEVEKFRTNTTLWNRNFPNFHTLLSEINPDAVKTAYRWWRV